MNIPMLWITLDLVELYYSGLPLRLHILFSPNSTL